MKIVNTIALILVILGGLNSLFATLFSFNFVHSVFGQLGTLEENIVYVLVGIAALICLPMVKKVATQA
jgi:uncharacterized membrane protein YuzA (DUF378 family)